VEGAKAASADAMYWQRMYREEKKKHVLEISALQERVKSTQQIVNYLQMRVETMAAEQRNLKR
jgi:hypothetical protein